MNLNMNNMSIFKFNGLTNLIVPVILILVMGATLYLGNYLIFHSFAELFSIFVALSISFVTYYTYSLTKNKYLLFLGLGYFWIGLLDIMHTQTYPGMNIFNVEGLNPTLTLWIFTRLFESLIFLTAPLMGNRDFSIRKIMLMYGVYSLFVVIFAMFFPLMLFDQESGLSLLKIASEYGIIFILLLSLKLNSIKKQDFHHRIYRAVQLAIIYTIISEVFFTLYSHAYGLTNLLGHVFKFLSFWVLLMSIIKTSLQQPIKLMTKQASSYNAIPIPAVVLSNDGLICQANNAAKKHLGLETDDIIGHSNHTLFHPAYLTALECPVCQAIDNKQNIFELEVIDTIKKCVNQYSLSFINTETQQGLIQVCVDITKMHNHSKQIKDLKERMELALAGNHDGVWDWDLLDNSVYFSPQWKEMLGFLDNELTNELSNWKQRVHPDDIEQALTDIQKNIDGETDSYENVSRMRHKDGHWVWILDRGKATYNEQGEAIRMNGTHTDISKQKQVEELLLIERNKLEGQHNYLQSIIDGIEEPIMVINEDYTIELMNETLNKKIPTLNITDPEHPKCYEVSHYRSTPCDGKDHPCPLQTVLESNRHSIVVHKHYDNDGTKHCVELAATPLFDKQQNCIGIIESARDITAHLQIQDNLRQQQKILDFQAHHDALTGLPNRVLFNDRLEQGIEKAKRNSTKLALLFIDLDHFKEINDSLGHDIGDRILKAVTKRLIDLIRKEDTISRLGGDEFTVIIDDLTHAQDASLLAQKLVGILAEPFTIGEHLLYISSSIGISLYPDDGYSTQDLLKYADAAMYKAKDEGRNNYQYYSAEMTKQALEKVVMETNLREAIKNQEFIVYYQPQVDGRDGRLIGVEALVRWQHPRLGFLSPKKFIPLAESTGLIIELDQLVMKTAMKQISKWYAQGLNPGRLALNLAIKQLEQEDFIKILKNLIKETQCKAKWLELEVTESQIMRNPDNAIKILRTISELGIELAIDDFGTGYSSLSYLKKLPINKLKIDQSFVQDLPDNKDDTAIAKAVIALAQSMNLKIIAEGVETKEQKDFLINNGCVNIQGYYYSKPIPADEMNKYLLKNNI